MEPEAPRPVPRALSAQIPEPGGNGGVWEGSREDVSAPPPHDTNQLFMSVRVYKFLKSSPVLACAQLRARRCSLSLTVALGCRHH